MTPVFMVNEETLKRTPQEVLTYLRFLRRRIQALEATNSQRRIEELEAANRKLQTEIEDLKGALQQVRQRLAHAQAQLGTNSTNSSLPPSSDRFHCKRRPPRTADQPRKQSGGQPGHPLQLRLLVPPEQVRQTI